MCTRRIASRPFRSGGRIRDTPVEATGAHQRLIEDILPAFVAAITITLVDEFEAVHLGEDFV